MDPASAAAVYGGAPPAQPSTASIIDQGGTNQSGARTDVHPAKVALVHSPTVWLVLILGAAIGLIHLSVRVGR